MNSTDSKAIVEKLNDLIGAAEEFGSQSEQLSKARNDFGEYLTAVNTTNSQMVAVINKCNEYIEDLRKLVDRDISAQMEKVVLASEESVGRCKSHCEEITNQYKIVVDLFASQRELFDKSQLNLVKSVEDNFVKSNEQSKLLVNEIIALCNTLKDELFNELSQNISSSNDSQITRLEAISVQQVADHKLVIFSVVASATAAIAAIIGLFV